jgi:3-deoxy-manno-octulosonate cytidylyltransferase (CMP-KDO synthetase)
MANHIVIPARFYSSRLPGKPLLEIDGKPLIWHVYQRALETGIRSIIVATDHIDIFDAVKAFGGNVVMTAFDHVNGTERLAEVAKIQGYLDDDIVVNLQGDEPLLSAELIASVVDLLTHNPKAGIATLGCLINDVQAVFNPNVVKITMTDSGKALYFSRAPIPWNRDLFSCEDSIKLVVPYYRHIGMYAYRASTLNKIAQLDESSLELCESLEQLRALQAGIEIQVGVIDEAPPHGVDTMDDYLVVKKLVENKNGS